MEPQFGAAPDQLRECDTEKRTGSNRPHPLSLVHPRGGKERPGSSSTRSERPHRILPPPPALVVLPKASPQPLSVAPTAAPTSPAGSPTTTTVAAPSRTPRPLPTPTSTPPPTSLAPVDPRASGADALWAVLTSTVVLILGGFATFGLAQRRRQERRPSLGAVAASRLSGYLVGVAVASASVSLLGTGRRFANAAASAVVIGAFAIGGGWLGDLSLPGVLLPQFNGSSQPW